MRVAERRSFIVLMSLQVLWGAAAWFSISEYGLGVSTDSVHLLFAAQNLLGGHGLISYDGSFLLYWPPLYPVLMAGARAITGVDMLGGAAAVQWIAFAGLAFTLAALALKVFPQRLWLASTAVLLAQGGAVTILAFGMVGSDYVFMFLALLFVLLTGRLLESTTPGTFIALIGIGILVTLQRYLGVAVVASGAMTLLLLGAGRLQHRFLRAGVLALSIIPSGVWLLITRQRYSTRPPVTFAENFTWFSRSILEWFTGSAVERHRLNPLIAVLWVAVVGVLWVIIRTRALAADKRADPQHRDAATQPSYAVALLLYGGFYVLGLLGAASTAYFNKLAGRLLLPLYIPFILMILLAIKGIHSRASNLASSAWRTAVQVTAFAALALWTMAVLRIAYPIIITSHAEGVASGENVFNSRPWRENPLIVHWTHNLPADEYVLLSNEPDGVAFSSQHAVTPAPRKRSGPYSTVEIPLDTYQQGLVPYERATYLVWLEPSPRDYFYSPDELSSIALIEQIYSGAGGAIYRLYPKP